MNLTFFSNGYILNTPNVGSCVFLPLAIERRHLWAEEDRKIVLGKVRFVPGTRSSLDKRRKLDEDYEGGRQQ